MEEGSQGELDVVLAGEVMYVLVALAFAVGFGLLVYAIWAN